MGIPVFPDQNEVIGRVIVSCRYRVNEEGHSHDPDNWIGGIPAETPYLTLTATSSPMSDSWYELQDAYESAGYETYLKRSTGTTRTRSGTCHHAPTQLFVWEE